MPDDSGGQREFTIDELAANAGMTVRNVRAYTGRGLLGAPRLAGRTGYYDHTHLQRLHLIRVLVDRGYTLSAVEKSLQDKRRAGQILDLIDVLHGPSNDDEPEVIRRDALAGLAGVEREDRLMSLLIDAQLVEAIDEDSVRLLNPTIVRAGVSAVRMGLSVPTVLAMLPQLQKELRSIADLFVGEFRDEVWQPVAGSDKPTEQWPALLEAIESLLPVAGQAVLAVFREQLGLSIDQAIGEELPPGGEHE